MKNIIFICSKLTIIDTNNYEKKYIYQGLIIYLKNIFFINIFIKSFIFFLI